MCVRRVKRWFSMGVAMVSNRSAGEHRTNGDSMGIMVFGPVYSSGTQTMSFSAVDTITLYGENKSLFFGTYPCVRL